MTFLDKKCDYCHRSYRAAPCADSDHYRTCIDLAYDAFKQPFISSACLHPTQQQADLPIHHMGRRHPHGEDRPIYSGYCVIDTCVCWCHDDEPLQQKTRATSSAQ